MNYIIRSFHFILFRKIKREVKRENKININNIYVITSDNVIDFNSSFVNLNSYVCSEITNIHDSNIQIYNIIRRNTEEKMYLNLLFKVLNKGEYKNGRNGITKSIFNPSNLVFTAVPTAKQIHILGSKQDIEGFKKFVTQPSTSVEPP